MLAALVVLVISFIQGPPDRIPAVALGWPLILYLERAALVAGVIMGIGGTADRMLRGDPVQDFSAPGGPGVQLVEEVAEVDEALRDVVDEGMRELDRAHLGARGEALTAADPRVSSVRMATHASPQRQSPFLARHKERIARVDRAIARLRRTARAESRAPRPEKRD